MALEAPPSWEMPMKISFLFLNPFLRLLPVQEIEKDWRGQLTRGQSVDFASASIPLSAEDY